MAIAMTHSLYAEPNALLNPSNTAKLDEESLSSILTGSMRFWENGEEIRIATLKNDPDLEEALKRYSGMTAAKFKNHWQRIMYSGRGKMPKQFATPQELFEYIKFTPGAISITSEKNVFPDVKSIRLSSLP